MLDLATPPLPGLDASAAALAPMVEVWVRLLADHVPDLGGHCSACTGAGTGAHDTPWPCVVRAVAESARQQYAACPETMATPVPAPRRSRQLRGPRGGSCAVTPRELDFLRLAAGGCADGEIAARLDLPTRTVGTSIRRIGRAVGVAERVALLVVALRSGVIA